MQYAFMRAGCSMHLCVQDAVCIYACRMQYAFMRAGCSMHLCVQDAVCIYACRMQYVVCTLAKGWSFENS